jgi:hypothetical protein
VRVSECDDDSGNGHQLPPQVDNRLARALVARNLLKLVDQLPANASVASSTATGDAVADDAVSSRGSASDEVGDGGDVAGEVEEAANGSGHVGIRGDDDGDEAGGDVEASASGGVIGVPCVRPIHELMARQIVMQEAISCTVARSRQLFREVRRQADSVGRETGASSSSSNSSNSPPLFSANSRSRWCLMRALAAAPLTTRCGSTHPHRPSPNVSMALAGAPVPRPRCRLIARAKAPARGLGRCRCSAHRPARLHAQAQRVAPRPIHPARSQTPRRRAQRPPAFRRVNTRRNGSESKRALQYAVPCGRCGECHRSRRRRQWWRQ